MRRERPKKAERRRGASIVELDIWEENMVVVGMEFRI
jgi:hypothetical protein